MEKTAALAALAVCLLLVLTACGAGPVPLNAVPVYLADAEGMTVLSGNPLWVTPGASAEFRVELAEGYVPITVPDGVAFDAESGVVRVASAAFPTTVAVRTWKNPGTFRFFIDNKGNGRAYSATEQGRLYEGTEIVVTAEPAEGCLFSGWSLKRYLADGGELYSAEPRIAFTLTRDMELCANFVKLPTAAAASPQKTAAKERVRDPATTRTLVYDANGGIVTDSGGTELSVPFDLSVYRYPNTLASQDVFFRPGYQLVGYNTKADGSGNYYGCGWKFIEDQTGSAPTRLYCVWMQETRVSDFTFTPSEGGMLVTAYTGDSETVVIPAYVDSVPVTGVAPYALKKKKVKTLVIPKSVTTVAENAVSDCASLETLYLFDSVRKISNTSFSGTTKFRKYRLQAALDPVFCKTVEGNFCRKFEYLVSCKSPKIVVESGSSSLYGINPYLMEELSGGKYSVVNYGTTAHTVGTMYLEMISHFVGPGDIVIHAPELDSTQAGSGTVSIGLYRAVEQYYNIFEYVDISRFTNLFGAFVEYNDVRASSEPTSYEDWGGMLFEKGDRQNSPDMNKPSYHAGSKFNYRANAYSAANIARLKTAYDLVLAAGAEMYFSIAPCNKNALTENALKPETQQAYMSWLRSAIPVPVIGELWEYVYEGQYMYNSDWHPNEVGRDMRTRLLYEELMAYRAEHGLK